MKTKPLPSLDRLKEVLEYSPETGRFFWRVGHRAGREAGTLHDHGYVNITIGKQKFRAHRLAWLYVHKEPPGEELQIDHINRVRADNRIENLRCVPRVVNMLNNGGKGYYWFAKNQRWVAQISIANKTVHLGAYKTEQEASDAYQRAKAKLAEDCLNRL